MDTFAGKVALVTGGSSGIGRATAIKFGEQGAKVVVAARREKEGKETVEMIRKAGGEAAFVRTDVRIASQVENMVNQTVEKYGRLDIAFNNAGVGGIMARMVRTTEEVFDEVVDTNFKGVWLSMKYEIPVMQKQGGGVIVNNASVSGVATQKDWPSIAGVSTLSWPSPRQPRPSMAGTTSGWLPSAPAGSKPP